MYSYLSESISHFSQSCFQCLYKTLLFDKFVLLFNVLGHKEAAIPGRLIPEMLQFGLEPAEKLPAILHRKILYYYAKRIIFLNRRSVIFSENISYLVELCHIFSFFAPLLISLKMLKILKENSCSWHS